MSRKAVIIGIVVALAAAGVYAAVQYFGGGANATHAKAACASSGCDWRGEYSLRPGDKFPPKCPTCGKQTVLPLSTCKKCGNQQILNELLAHWVPGNEKLSSKTKCSKCGGPIVHGD